MWQVTRDTWHITCDTWHITHGVGWTFSQNFSWSGNVQSAYSKSWREAGARNASCIWWCLPSAVNGNFPLTWGLLKMPNGSHYTVQWGRSYQAAHQKEVNMGEIKGWDNQRIRWSEDLWTRRSKDIKTNAERVTVMKPLTSTCCLRQLRYYQIVFC